MGLTQAHKDAISRGQIERYKRGRETHVDEPTHKRCTKCGVTKPRYEFCMRKRKLACGEVHEYPAGECMECAAARAAAYRAKLLEEGKLREREHAWNSKRDAEHKREYNREYGAARRRAEGMKARGPWKKYRERGRGRKLEIGPLSRFLAGLNGGVGALARRTGEHERLIYRIVNQKQKTVSTEVADRILHALGMPDQLSVLYPE
jgi:Ni,Fe-hydrogenase I large subunit